MEMEAVESIISDNEGAVTLHGSNFNDLPEECIALIVAFTTPSDACRLELVSKYWQSASKSDLVWNRFLLSVYGLIVTRSEEREALLAEFPAKKQLYMRLADRPLLIDDATKSFWLDKPTGKICLMIASRTLYIAWGATPGYWQGPSIPESRFPQVAELLSVCWLEIRGGIKTSMLSPETHYAAFLVFKITEDAYGLDGVSEVSVGTAGGETRTQRAYLHDVHQQRPTPGVDHYPSPRADGWREVKIGEFFTHLGEEHEVHLSVLSIKALNWKRGLIVEGIEVRPIGANQ